MNEVRQLAAGEAILSEAATVAPSREKDREHGQDDALEELLGNLVRQHSRLVYRIAYAVLRRHHDAEDATQETFVRVLRYSHKLADVEDHKTWLARIAWRVAVDRGRQQRRKQEIPLEDPEKPMEEFPSANAAVDDALHGLQVGDALERMIAALPGKLRQPLILSTIEEMSAAKADRAEKPVHPYRVDFSVYELEDGKKINTRQYSLNLNAEDANELKIGTRVPVETKEGEFQYLDVGTNIWCRIGERSDGIPLSVRAELSNFAVPEQGAGQSVRPAIRQLQIHASTVAVLGKPMIVGSVDDPNSKRQFQLEVTVTKLR